MNFLRQLQKNKVKIYSNYSTVDQEYNSQLRLTGLVVYKLVPRGIILLRRLHRVREYSRRYSKAPGR